MKNSVNILGLPYTIKEVQVINKEQFTLGQIDYVNLEILIDESLSNEKKELILLHEILHGICEAIGADELNENEQVIQGLSSSLYHLLKSQTIFSWFEQEH